MQDAAWKIVVVAVCVVALGSADLCARGVSGKKDEGKKDGGGAKGGGAAPHAPGGGGHPPPSPNTALPNHKQGTAAHPRNENRPPATVNRTPTFSHPNPGPVNTRPGGVVPPGEFRRSPENKPHRDVHKPGEFRVPSEVLRRNEFQAGENRHPGAQTPGVAWPDGRNPAGGTGNVIHPVRINRSGVAGRPVGGTSVVVGNHQIPLAGNNYRPAAYAHTGYHGYWNGNYGQHGGYWRGAGYGPGWGYGPGVYGPRRYSYRPLGWGLGAWGLGAAAYSSGYLGYSNPYYAGGGYNYAQPIPVSYAPQPQPAADGLASADDMLRDAISAFKANDYDVALGVANTGIAAFPSDSMLHEFRALVLFAREDYQPAAATVHSVLAVGPGWDWTTLSGLYADISLYAQQLRVLEVFVQAHPDDGAAHFLLAYHYMTCGHTQEAAGELRQVVQLVPGDRVAADLLRMISVPQNAGPGDPGQPPAPGPDAAPDAGDNAGPGDAPEADAPAIDPAALIGTWRAAREDGSKFVLTLDGNSTFVWKFSPLRQPPQELSGSFTLKGNVLALGPEDGGSLVGTVTPDGDDQFNFKLVGGPQEDPGLDFSR